MSEQEPPAEPSPPGDDTPMFSSLSEVQRGAFLGFMSPILTIILVLKTMTLTHIDLGHPWYVWPDLYLSDVALFVGTSGLSLALLGSRRVGKIALPLIQVLYIGWMFFELVGYRFYFTTGSTLDWQLIVLYLSYIKQLWGMVSVLNETLSRALIMGLAACFMLLPWLLIKRYAKREDDTPKIRTSRLLIAGVVGLVLSTVFPLISPDQRVGRNTIVEIGMSTVEHLQQKATARQHLKVSRSDRTITKKPDDTPKSVILILLESTGSHVTGPYNPKAEKFTPALTEFASQGITFDHTLAVVPHTSKALFALHCSSYPNPVVSLTEAGSRGIQNPCLPELLREQGYQTAYFQGATLLFENNYSLLKNIGYDHMVGADDLEPTPFERLNYFGYEEKALVEPGRTWLQNRDKEKPFLLTFMTLAPHHDYKLPKGYTPTKYHDDPEFNQYLNCVAYSDEFVKDLLDMLDEQGVLDDSIVAIVGDHGEGFGEHGRPYHDNVIYQEALRIPFLLRGPGVPKGAVIKEPASQLDLMPTLAALAGFTLDGDLDGVDLLDAHARAQPRDLISYCWYERACASLVDWPYKLIHHYDQQPNELFDLATDPKERENLLANAPPEGVDVDAMQARLLKALAQKQAEHEAHAQE